MKQYQVVLSKTAEKNLSKLSAQVINKIVPNLHGKGLNPINRPNSNASKESLLMYQFRFSKIPFIKQ